MTIAKKMKDTICNTILLIMPKSITHKHIYKKNMNKTLNLSNPIDFNEKIQWLMVNKYGKREGLLSDKYRVKKYVEELKIPGLHIPKTLFLYKDANEININDLPDKFVLKCNHGSGDVFVCNDKKTFDIENAKKILGKNIKESFIYNGFEYHYKYIKPLIIAEEYLSDGTGKNPMDYKFYVFDGKCDRVLICTERDTEVRLNNFDLNWNKLNDTLENLQSTKEIPKPENFEKMVRIAESLCKKNGKVELPFARVDLYDINGKIYFGEYTFTPACGMNKTLTDKALLELGSKLNLDSYK